LIDIIFGTLMVIALVKGYKKGLIIALFSIVAYIIGLAAAIKLSTFVAGILENHFTTTGKWLPFISFILVFILVVLLVHWGGKLIEKMAELTMMGWLNKLGGIFFYALIYTIIFSVFLFYAEKIKILSEATIAESFIAPYIKPWGPQIIEGIGKVIPLFKNMFEDLSLFFEHIPDKLSN
jgi:membrane protein required for colicin V production